MLLNSEFLKKYFRLGLPIILSQLIVIAVNNISVSLMGSLSSDAISGYTFASESFSIFSMISLGLTGGFHIYISQYYGAGNREKYNQVLRYGMKLCLIVSCSFALGFFLLADPFLKVFASDEVIIRYGVEYLKLFCWSFVPYMMNLLWSETYAFTGQTRITMISGAIDSIVTLAASYLFLSVMQMGIAGAGLAVVLGRGLEALFYLYVLNRKDSPFAFRGHYGKLAGSEVTEIVGRSIPLVVNEAAFSVAYFFMMRHYGLVSQSSVACLAVANNVSQLFFIGNKAGGPVIGVTVGGELGKGNYTDARNNALKTYLTCFALVACGGALMFLAAPVIPGFFHLEGELAQLCIRMLRMKAVIGAFGGNTMIFYNILRIGGATREVFIQDGLFSLLGPMLVSFIFSHFIPVSFLQLYIIVESMQIVKTGLGYYFFRKGTWLRKLSS